MYNQYIKSEIYCSALKCFQMFDFKSIFMYRLFPLHSFMSHNTQTTPTYSFNENRAITIIKVWKLELLDGRAISHSRYFKQGFVINFLKNFEFEEFACFTH